MKEGNCMYNTMETWDNITYSGNSVCAARAQDSGGEVVGDKVQRQERDSSRGPQVLK